MRLSTRPLGERLGARFGPDVSVAGQSLVALVVNSSTSLLAGAFLGSITGTLERLPGLLVLVPAAIGLRGNVFSALGSRLSTAIHAGQFRPSLRRGTLVGDNLVASLLLTAGLSLATAVVAKVVAVAFGLQGTISVLDLVTISVLGGMLASVVVLVATIGLAIGGVRYGWDLDNLVAPVVSTLGDVLTLPALWLAAQLVMSGAPTEAIGTAVVAATAVSIAYGWRTRRDRVRSLVHQSWPILVAAAVLSTLAGVVVEKRLASLVAFPALLILVPAFVSSAGALGGILASRLGSRLHLGVLAPDALPPAVARRDARQLALLAVPIYAFNAVGAHLLARALGDASPGADVMVVVSLTAAAATVLFVSAVAYYGSIVAFRFRVDPDTYGIPVVTSSVDFAGAIALVSVAVAFGIA